MTKSKTIDLLTILMGILNLTGYLFISGREETKTLEIIIISSIIAFSYFVLYQFYKRKNWARILVIITSVIALLNLFTLKDSSTIVAIILIISAILGLFLLFWLNKTDVKALFKKEIPVE